MFVSLERGQGLIMGKKALSRGKAFEYRVRDYFRRAGFKADRVPVSGVAPVMKGDVVVEVGGRQMRCELKYRVDGFKEIYRWLEEAKRDGCGVLVIGAYRKKPLVVLEVEDYLEMLKKVAGGGL